MSTMTLEERREREVAMSYGSVISTSVVCDVVRLLKATMVPRSLSGEESQRRKITDLEGLGREIWQGVDAREYINELRDEWDHR